VLRAVACLASFPAQTPPGPSRADRHPAREVGPDARYQICVDDQRRARDSAGLTVLVRAHRQAVADGGELRLVLPAGGAVARVFAITRLDLFIPLFGSLDEALAPRPAAVILPLRPPGGRRRVRQPG
jgi:hypothetical protein